MGTFVAGLRLVMRLRTPPSFAQRLLLYGLSLTAPVLALCGALVYQYSSDRYRSIESEALFAARQLANALDSEFDRSILLLETLIGTLGPEMDLARLHRHAKETLTPRGTTVVVTDVGGWPLLNTSVPYGQPLPAWNTTDCINMIVEQAAPLVSDMKTNPVTKKPFWMVGAPVRRDNGITAIISILRPTSALQSLLPQNFTAPEWQWRISDRKNTVIAGSSASDIPVGAIMPDAVTETSYGQEGVSWITDSGGARILHGYARSKMSGWLTSVSIPAAVVEAPLRDAWMLFAIGSLFLLALALFLGISIARKMHSNVEFLVDSAARMGRSEPLTSRRFSVREFQEIHQALSHASTERQNSEARRQLLLRELQHRTNNLLAVISSIARRTLFEGRSIADARETLLGRLRALANASDTLSATHWQGADIGVVVQNEMRAFAGRYSATGPELLLSAQAAQNTSLVIHELATNASKYGALSHPDGQVTITWSITGHNENAQLNFSWVERGGPPATPPQRRGFGHTLLETVLSDADKKPEFKFEPEGLSYSTSVSLCSVLAGVNNPPGPK